MAIHFFTKKMPAQIPPDGQVFYRKIRCSLIARAAERCARFVAAFGLRFATRAGVGFGIESNRRGDQAGDEKPGEEHFFGFHVEIFFEKWWW